ncbi:phosphotransferase family protein [Phenylobacterium sp.]|uniref:phosphotransferase family protein n=1 Tax=Phenylobacterium sp. TaxID=1871053 RepID=UPI00301DC81D
MIDGHAGLTYGFKACASDGSLTPYVLKLGPAGVRRSGSTDIFRQAQLLRTLREAGYPAPYVPWACAADAPLGAPFIVMERLPGRTFIIWEPSPALVREAAELPRMWIDTARAMGQLHRLPWRKHLEDWEAPTTLTAELERWSALLHHTDEPAWLDLAGTLHTALRRDIPSSCEVGVVHGDFQPGNVLFEHGRLTGVIDWDLAGIGPQGLDVGWLLLMADRESWAEGWKPVAPPPRSDLLNAYWRAGGRQRTDLNWYQAFACFRLAAISGLNLKLHRSGRRRDAVWEKFAPSIRVMLERGKALL